jgi:hypothetical protein
MLLMKTILSCLFALLFALTPASAVIIVLAPTDTTEGSLEITQPIHFPITQSGDANVFVFQDWVTSDGNPVQVALFPELSFSLNQNSLTRQFFIGDNADSTYGDVGPSDGFLGIPDPDAVVAVEVGDTLTLSVGTYAIFPVAGFNPQATQTFTGNMFVTDNVGNRLSEIMAVPEPSAYAAVLGVVSLALLLRRRRRA